VGKQGNGAAFHAYGRPHRINYRFRILKTERRFQFLPVNVENEEKLFSVGKIPGGFNKKKGKAFKKQS